MNRTGLLRSIAETGYNVGFGAKKNFATHDIVQKVPSGLGLVSLLVGLYALVWEPLNAKLIAATMVAFGIITLIIAQYDHNKVAYSEEGERLTTLFYRLRDLYRDVQATAEGADLAVYRAHLDALQAEVSGSSQSKQILFSDWYAHYKFFWQHQIEWIDEQKKFTFWRDKVPFSFSFTLAVSVLALVAIGIARMT
ncbi:SLATT domain-containing protein [Novosphingobium sp. SG707]|uniref:SLATT domain-containing protein n=1 Tax=Novosphingobium sp. SG707 TaxID=2586996 RepID=UPI0017A8085C|nr:SLATT domain-containing protein [Novosphingobium sp. SG707]NKI99977.1 hypothetical protein [Novosphingobium sp. SG707]